MLVDTYILNGFEYRLYFNDAPSAEFGERGWYYLIVDLSDPIPNRIVHESDYFPSFEYAFQVFCMAMWIYNYDNDDALKLLMAGS